MLRTLLILALGAVLGYTYGFRDARDHDQTVVARALERVARMGGDGRKYSAGDADAMMRRAER